MPAPLGTSSGLLKQISQRGCTDEVQNLLPTLVGMWLSTWRVPGECPEGRWTSLVADAGNVSPRRRNREKSRKRKRKPKVVGPKE